MKLEFKPEDFPGLDEPESRYSAEMANDKLEKYIKEHGKVTYGYEDMSATQFVNVESCQFTHKAILINIEPLAEKCTHPKEKIKEIRFGMEAGLCVGSIGPVGGSMPGKKEVLYVAVVYQCECGAKVEPSEFKEVGE